MKKHNLYFEIKKNLVFALLNFLSKSFYALSKWMIKMQYNYKINILQNIIKLISETLNLSFFFLILLILFKYQ